MVFLTKRKQIAVKIEAVEGVEETLADIDVIAPVYSPDYSIDNVQNDRLEVVQPSFSRLSQVNGEINATLSFSTELKGSGAAGTAPAHLTDLLQACGLSETIVPATSVTYAPVTEDIPSVTLEMREGAEGSVFKSKKLLGARGTVKFVAAKGGIVMCEFEFKGKYVKPTDTVAFAQPSPGVIPKTFLGVAFSVHGVGTLNIQNLSIDMGNEIIHRPDVNDSTGYKSALYVGRQPKAEVDPEQVAVATLDFFAKIRDNSEGILTYALTGSAGNIMTFSAPKAQFINLSDGDSDSIRTEELEMSLNQDGDEGDDEFTIVFT